MSVAPTPDGGFIAGGGYNAGNVYNLEFYATLVKLDADGAVQWQRQIETNDRLQLFATSISAAGDGGYITGAQNWIFKVDRGGDITSCELVEASDFKSADVAAEVVESTAVTVASDAVAQDARTVAEDFVWGSQNARCSAMPAPKVVEYYNGALDHYFITWMPDEIAKLDTGTLIKGWTRTGYSFNTYTSAQSGTSTVCRYYIPPALGDSHFFGRDINECIATGDKFPSLVLEELHFMQMLLPVNGVCPSGTAPVYRVFDNRSDGNHRYTTDPSVRDQMIARGWIAEGDGPDRIAMCAPQ
jgi:hypothetical protein